MREIIFRGKRLHNGEWVEGTPFFARNCCKMIVAVAIHPDFVDIGNVYYSEGYPVDPSTVGQYTGRQCKNGKVFDGDIGKNIDGVFLVCWDEEKAAFVMRFLEYPFETLYLEEMHDDTEIIGNIYDNPELLLESKEECNT